MVGLGNPGSGYAANRHNVGFMAVDAIVERHGLGPYRSRFQGQVAEGSVAGRKVLVLKPMTYMNNSGRAVAAAARFYKISPEDMSKNMIVFHDELDLTAGKTRFKEGGGHAGHNGLRSLHAHVGPDYARIRLGIGHPGDKDRVTGHVLRDFAKADRVWLDPMLDAIGEQFPLLVKGDSGAFMSKVALAVNPPKPKKSEPQKSKPKPSKPPERADGV